MAVFRLVTVPPPSRTTPTPELAVGLPAITPAFTMVRAPYLSAECTSVPADRAATFVGDGAAGVELDAGIEDCSVRRDVAVIDHRRGDELAVNPVSGGNRAGGLVGDAAARLEDNAGPVECVHSDVAGVDHGQDCVAEAVDPEADNPGVPGDRGVRGIRHVQAGAVADNSDLPPADLGAALVGDASVARKIDCIETSRRRDGGGIHHGAGSEQRNPQPETMP